MSDSPHLLYQDASNNPTPDNDLGGDQFTDSSILDPDYEDGMRRTILRAMRSALGDDFDETDLDSLAKTIAATTVANADNLGGYAVQSELYDTAPAVARVGAFGWGLTAGDFSGDFVLKTGQDLNDTRPNGLYYVYTDEVSNAPPGVGNGHLLQLSHWSQIYIEYNTGDIWTRGNINNGGSQWVNRGLADGLTADQLVRNDIDGQFVRGILGIRGTGVGTENVSYVEFQDKNGDRTGYVGDGSGNGNQMWEATNGRCEIRDNSGVGYVWTAANTTTDSNGNLKAASPIFRLANDPADVTSDQFTAAGAGGANGEASGVTAKRTDTGVYVVSGSLGFATDGVWPIPWVIPQDGNGNNLVFVETDQADDGTLTIKTYSRKFDVSSASVVADEPMDIPDGRWVDLRLRMPEPDESEAE